MSKTLNQEELDTIEKRKEIFKKFQNETKN